ncbi:MAG: alpha/beta hydrolase family protein [Bacteroidales bacterium]
MNKRVFVVLLSTLMYLSLSSQKKQLGHDVYDNWKQIDKSTITDDGKWSGIEINPQKGDGELIILNNSNTEKRITIPRGSNPIFFGNDMFALVKIKQPVDSIRKAKVKKKNSNDLPKDSLSIIALNENLSLNKLPYKSKYKVAKEAPIILYTEEIKIAKDTTDKKSKVSRFNRLNIANLVKGDTIKIDSVSDYELDKKASLILYSKEADSLKSIWSFHNGIHKELFRSKTGKIGKFIIDEEGDQVAILATKDSSKTATFELFYSKTSDINKKPIKVITPSKEQGIPEGYSIAKNISFSKEGTRLHVSYAITPKPEIKDTLLAEEKFSLDLWSYSDTINMPQQIFEAKKLKEENFTIIYNTKYDNWFVATTPQFKTLTFATDEKSTIAICVDAKPYLWGANWENPHPRDVYAVNTKNNTREIVRKKLLGSSGITPNGDYILFFDREDSKWHSYNTKTKEEKNISAHLEFPLYDENNDVPSAAKEYGFVGYGENSKTAYIYDKYDIWELDLEGKSHPRSITSGWGRENKRVLRHIDLKKDNYKNIFNIKEYNLLSSFNEDTKEYGFYSIEPDGQPKKLIETGHKYTLRGKAKDADKILFQRENYNEFRDLWLSDSRFNDPKKITNANPQMNQYKWGSVEIMKWRDFNGKSVEGLLYKPEEYDSTKLYPTIVYFYERHTQDLYRHHHPQPSWSIIIPSMFTSNDYVVFMPDISYTVGYPGESCYNAVVSGTTALIDRGISDPNNIGLQGQSWGGYQIAYLVTRTNMFKCASPGTPVSNMTSAYSGIRTGSGLVRMFQYEYGQSRIGASLWDAPMRYIENSPIFYAPKVETPMLIRHCDADEAVPFSQGVELFMALKRNGKKAWLLNYNREAHNLRTRPARMDWTIRMHQFFDFYLKGDAEPRWMKEGISITEKGLEQKYETIED